MKNKITTLVVLGLSVLTISCSTVTIRETGTARLSSEPTYLNSKPYFLFGLVGEHRIDVKSICGSSRPVQM